VKAKVKTPQVAQEGFTVTGGTEVIFRAVSVRQTGSVTALLSQHCPNLAWNSRMGRTSPKLANATSLWTGF
jgi:hypothetical protein